MLKAQWSYTDINDGLAAWAEKVFGIKNKTKQNSLIMCQLIMVTENKSIRALKKIFHVIIFSLC